MLDRRYVRSRAPLRPVPHPAPRHRCRGISRFMAVSASALLLASCRQAGVLDPQGPIASQELLLLINTTEIMLVVVVPVILMALGFAWWYRAGNTRANHSPDWAYQGGIELVVWSIPALVVILVGGGTKKRQQHDISTALAHWQDYKRRKRGE